MPCQVLIAEDDPLIAEALVALLKDAGLEVQCVAATVNEAMKSVQATLPDIALLDINLHGEHVYPAATVLLEHGVPFVFTTGYEADLVVPSQFREVPFLSKPYDIDQVLTCMVSLLA
jgi:chemotaxis family two-component system sensor kinase Cph1